MNALEKKIYREIYRRSLYEFVKDFWNEADPDKFIDGKLIQIYCEIFQFMCKPWIGYTEPNVDLPKFPKDAKVIDIRKCKQQKLNLNVPPRHTKSMIYNVEAPVWFWSFFPIKAASISHTGDLSSKMNSKRQSIINSQRYKELFNIKLVANSNSFIKDERGGELYSVNRNSFTGYGGNIIINDDLTNAEAAKKDKEEMENAWSYYRNTMPSRINDIEKYVIMNIQQRLAPNDISGRIQSDQKLSQEYIHIVFPAQFSQETFFICPISGEIIHWNKGDYLWPERFGNYESLRIDVGESTWNSQYLQNPIAGDKTIIKDDMIIEKNYVDCPTIENADVIYASHDFPVKDKETSDFLGSILGYKVGGTLYIIDCLEKKMAFKKSVDYVKGIEDMYPGTIQIIEDKANGSPIIQQLQDEIAGIQAFQPGTQSKTQRLESASLYMTNVVFVQQNYDKFTSSYTLSDNLKNLKDRLINFPFVTHDDIIDAFSMLLLFVFLDKRFMVYGRAFNDSNIIDLSKSNLALTYSMIFFNKEGDIWKASEIAVNYGVQTKLVVKREIRFKASIEEGLQKLKEFGINKNIFIDCSFEDSLRGMHSKGYTVERYNIEDFEQSVAQLNLAFSKKVVLIEKTCRLTFGDISNFKFSKNKDDTVKYNTQKDGLVSCIRVALKYFGGIG